MIDTKKNEMMRQTLEVMKSTLEMIRLMLGEVENEDCVARKSC